MPTNTTWIRCGTGAIQLLKDRSTRRVRFFSQRSKTKEVTGNHLGGYGIHSCLLKLRHNHDIHVVPITSETTLRPKGKYEERSWIWFARYDYSNNTGRPKKELFAVRFNTSAGANTINLSRPIKRARRSVSTDLYCLRQMRRPSKRLSNTGKGTI